MTALVRAVGIYFIILQLCRCARTTHPVSSRSSSYITAGPGAQMVLINGASALNVFWVAESYIALGPGSTVSRRAKPAGTLRAIEPHACLRCFQCAGRFIAQDYVTLTNAAVVGAVLSINAVTTLTVSAVRLPPSGSLPSSGYFPSSGYLGSSYNTGSAYNTPVNMFSAGSFAVLGGSSIVNTVRVCAWLSDFSRSHVRSPSAGPECDQRQCWCLPRVGPSLGCCP